MVKNMIKEAESKAIDIRDNREIRKIYGYTEDLIEIVKAEKKKAEVKDIYEILLEKVTQKNGSLIPSRNEKKTAGIKWKVVWKNQVMLKGVTAEEKCFAWKIAQDMVEVGNRIHRKNANRNCQRVRASGDKCNEIEDIYHCVSECEVVMDCFKELKDILQILLERDITDKEIINYGYNHRNKKLLRVALWLTTKALYRIYLERNLNKKQVWIDLVKEIEWNLEMQMKVGTVDTMERLRRVIRQRKLI